MLRPPARQRGFTMIELMCVLFIVGVLLLAVVPSLDGLVPKYRLRSGAREVGSMMEEAQSQAIARRKEFVLAFDLDQHAYWLLLPPEDPEQPQGGGQGGGLLGELMGGGDEQGKEAGRPRDDVEHGLPPPDPEASDEDEREDLPVDEREALKPRSLPDDVVFTVVTRGDEEHRNGRVYVPFSHLGGAGSCLVGLAIKGEGGEPDKEIFVRFNALTRTLIYAEDGRPELLTIDGGGS